MLKNFILIFAVFIMSAITFGLLAVMGRDYMTIGHGLHPIAVAIAAVVYAATVSLFLAALMDTKPRA